MNIFATITKYDDEQGLVYGYASTEALDSQGEVVKREAIADSLDDYMKWANLREMHQPSAVGVVNEASIDEKGLYIVGKVVDAVAREKCREGVYKGFSIGGKSERKKDGVISKLKLVEISLVDRPANPECKIEMYKMDRDGEIILGDARKADDVAWLAGAVDQVSEMKCAVDEVAEVKKGMYTVAWLAGLVDQLNEIKSSAEWEAEYEGDASAIPAKLRAAVTDLSAILVEMTQEEAAELTAGEIEVVALVEPAADVEKAGKTISAANMTKVQAMHDATIELGAMCAGDGEESKAASNEDIAKMATLDESIKKLETDNAELVKQVGALDATIRKMLAEPAPIKGALRYIEKGQDVNFGKAEQAVEPVTMTADLEKAEIATMVKQIQAAGGRRLIP